MMAVARAIIGESLADEVVQEAWVSIYRSLGKFEGRSSLKTWILTITANEAKSRLRKENRMVSLDSMLEDSGGVMPDRFGEDGHWSRPPVSWHEDTPEALLDNQQLLECIDKIMGQLPEQQRAALSLKEMKGISLDEICNILGISSSNVRVLLHRARHRLFEHIDHFQETGKC